MAHSPQKPCKHPGCPQLVDSSARYCLPHQRQAEARERQDRGTSHERGYTRLWQKIRLMFLRQHPLCEKCGQSANEVHHIKPLAHGGTHGAGNLAALCKSCHSGVTAKETGWRNTRW